MTRNYGPPLLRLLSLGLLVAAVSPAVGQDDALPKAEEILAKAIEATGGEAAYKALSTRKVTGTIEFVGAGLKGKLILEQEAPNKMKTSLELENVGTFLQGTDGTIAYEINPVSGERVLEGPEKAAFLREAAFYSDVEWQNYYDQAETKEVMEVDGTPCYVVAMTPKEGRVETRFYAVDSGLLVKSRRIVESPMGEIPVESFVSDYQEVDGLKIPFVSTEVLLGQEVKTTIQSVEHGVAFPEGTFAIPEAIKERAGAR